MRTIKSQDGKTIVNAEKSQGFYTNIYRIYDHSFGSIAEYSTEKRALRVLDMLNEWLTSMCFGPAGSTWGPESAKDYKWYVCFQMPNDSEELDA